MSFSKKGRILSFSRKGRIYNLLTTSSSAACACRAKRGHLTRFVYEPCIRSASAPLHISSRLPREDEKSLNNLENLNSPSRNWTAFTKRSLVLLTPLHPPLSSVVQVASPTHPHLSEEGTTSKVWGTFTRKTGPDCLICARFARQRTLLLLDNICSSAGEAYSFLIHFFYLAFWSSDLRLSISACACAQTDLVEISFRIMAESRVYLKTAAAFDKGKHAI